MTEYWISLRTLIHVVASVFFTLQMVFAVQKYMAKPTILSPGTKPFSSLKEPLQITVCKADQFNYTRAAGLAYSSSFNHLAGKTTNRTLLSWSGLNENHTFEETINFFYNSTKDIGFAGFSGPISGIISSRFIIPYGVCKVFEGKPASFMVIKLETAEISPHVLFVSDPTATTSFQFPYSLMTGDQIKLQPPQYVDHNIQIKETTVYTDDGSCVDYPNSRYESYSDCVDAEMRERILPTLGCMIPWISKQDACTNQIQRLPEHELLLNWTLNMVADSWGGIEYESESCRPACTILSAHSKEITSGIPTFNHSSIYLHFRKQYEVQKIVLAYDSTALLVEIGSCLGLWLGLSVVGIFDLVVLAVQKTQWAVRKTQG